MLFRSPVEGDAARGGRSSCTHPALVVDAPDDEHVLSLAGGEVLRLRVWGRGVVDREAVMSESSVVFHKLKRSLNRSTQVFLGNFCLGSEGLAE